MFLSNWVARLRTALRTNSVVTSSSDGVDCPHKLSIPLLHQTHVRPHPGSGTSVRCQLYRRQDILCHRRRLGQDLGSFFLLWPQTNFTFRSKTIQSIRCCPSRQFHLHITSCRVPPSHSRRVQSSLPAFGVRIPRRVRSVIVSVVTRL